MGHSEPASGLCSLAKVIIAMEKGKIPANLHYKNPNPNIPSLSDGRIKVSKYQEIVLLGIMLQLFLDGWSYNIHF